MTELTVIETGEVVEQLSRVEAERITSRIADKLDAIADNLEQVLPLIGEALTRRAWEALGYASPSAYVSERFKGAMDRLSPEVRRPVVAQLSAAGMSTRAIAPVVGVSQPQVVADKKAAGDQRLITSPAPTETPAPLPTSENITGMDGKQYAMPVAKAEAQKSVKQEASRDTQIVNDIRLYLGHIGTAPEIAALPPKGKQYIIAALENTITQLRSQS